MIKGIVAAVPKNVVANDDFTQFTTEHRNEIAGITGVLERRHGSDVISLAAAAAGTLLGKLGWAKESIGAIVFVTQTPTRAMPAMACALAGVMGINCPAFDVNMACSGYVYGLWVAETLAKRTLLIAGDTVSTMVDMNDRSTAMLFGDCVTATALEDEGFQWVRGAALGTDGTGWHMLTADPKIRMDGSEVFNFTLRTVPGLVSEVTQNGHVDFYLFHQANAFMLRHLAKKCKLPDEKVPMNIAKYGNTSSASIPLLMADSQCTERLKTEPSRVALFGFGAGWSWGGCMLDLETMKVLEVVEV